MKSVFRAPIGWSKKGGKLGEIRYNIITKITEKLLNFLYDSIKPIYKKIMP